MRARHVYLDVTHLGAAFVKRRFPTIYATCLRYDIDMTKEWIPFGFSQRTLHDGGVWTDVDGRHHAAGTVCCGRGGCSGAHALRSSGRHLSLKVWCSTRTMLFTYEALLPAHHATHRRGVGGGATD